MSTANMSPINTFRQGEEVYKIAFVALHLLGGQIGMLLVLSTSLYSRRIVRQATFINVCATMVLFSVSHLILFYTGEARNPNPRFSSCVLQTGMVAGARPMLSISGFLFLLQIFLVLRQAVFRSSLCEFSKPVIAMMIVTPYMVYMTIFTIVVVAAYRNPHTVIRATYYCDTALHGMVQAVPVISAMAVIGGVIIQVMIWFTIHRHWQEFRKIGTEASSSILTLGFIIRALIFSLFWLFALLISIAFLVRYMGDAVQNLVIAMVPFFAFLIFGFQSDLLQEWNIQRIWARPLCGLRG